MQLLLSLDPELGLSQGALLTCLLCGLLPSKEIYFIVHLLGGCVKWRILKLMKGNQAEKT